MNTLTAKFALLLIVACSASFGLGYYTAPEMLATESYAYFECDTDADCFEKNGCGGYTDPCE